MLQCLEPRILTYSSSAQPTITTAYSDNLCKTTMKKNSTILGRKREKNVAQRHTHQAETVAQHQPSIYKQTNKKSNSQANINSMDGQICVCGFSVLLFFNLKYNIDTFKSILLVMLAYICCVPLFDVSHNVKNRSNQLVTA